MKPERLENLETAINNIIDYFGNVTLTEHSVDEMGSEFVLNKSDLRDLQDRMEALIERHNFTYSVGEGSKNFRKDVEMVGSVSISYREAKPNEIRIGVAV